MTTIAQLTGVDAAAVGALATANGAAADDMSNVAADTYFPNLIVPVTDAGLGAAKTRKGFSTGHVVIGQYGDFRTDPHAFVGLIGDEVYANTAQEVRGVSYTVRNYRTTADEATLGWDFFGVIGCVVVSSANTQYIRGNQKAVVGELYFEAPLSGSYSVRQAHNFQASAPAVGANVTVENWYGLAVNSPTGSGAITTGYGVYVKSIDKPTTKAAIKIDGTEDAGQIKWTGVAITEDASGKLEIDANSKHIAFVNASTAATAGAGAATLPANPTFFLNILVGGVGYKIPVYPV